MDFKTYQQESKRTCPSLGDIKLDLSHMVLGMGSELSELQIATEKLDTTNIGEELADYEWYLSNYYRLRGYIYDDYKYSDTYYSIIDLYHETSVLQDYVKKYIAYDKLIDVKLEQELLGRIRTILGSFYNDYDLRQDEYLQKNINKLRQRYPEKFDAKLAVNRDIDAERKILEA